MSFPHACLRTHASPEYLNLQGERRVWNVYCEHQGHEALDDPIVHANRQEEAAECHAAKQMALQATTEEATDIALKKVRAFCES